MGPSREEDEMIRAFIRLNRRLCDRIQKHLTYTYLQDDYVRVVTAHLRAGMTVLDVGAGKSTPFAAEGVILIGCDISGDEICQNRSLTKAIVCDVSKHIGLPSASVDLVVSRSVIEHIPNVAQFHREAMRILKPGGKFIHVHPSRFAPFAILNSLLPNKLTKRLLAFLMPESLGIQGFPVVYDHCYPSAMRKLLTQSGFRVHEMRCQFYQSSYFNFFLPLFLLSVTYDLLIAGLNVQNLCAAMLYVAEKPLLAHAT
jgi:SAM-dependent methyltransferase